MKLKALAVAAALLGVVAPAYASQWWSPKSGANTCVPWTVSPREAMATFALNGYPDANLSEVKPGVVVLYLTANHKGGFVFVKDRAACDSAAPAIDELDSQYK
jgi:hypothetical protein